MANDKAFKIKNGLNAKRYLQNKTVVSASDIDLSTGTYFTKTPTANTTFTISNPPASGTAASFALEITGANVVTGYDLANASYDNKSFDVSSQEGTLRGTEFNSDGTKLYVVGTDTDSVYQYSLSTAYDVSTASYDSVSFSVSSQETNPCGIRFKTDGTKMFIVGFANDNVYEYSLSTAFDISSASYTTSFSVSTQDTAPLGLAFKPDGTRMYIAGNINDNIFQYSLSTAWDISTASYDNKAANITPQDTVVVDVGFKSDGTKMFVAGSSGEDINQYSLSTAWDVSTASFDNVIFETHNEETNINGFTIKPDGTKFYTSGTTSDTVFQYSFSSSALATIAYPASVKFSGGTTPSAPANGEKDLLVFTTTDGGTTYFGKQAGDALS